MRGILSMLLDPSPMAGTPSPIDDFWYEAIGGNSSSGVRVTPEGALRISAVYQGVHILSTVFAMLPLITYRRLPRGKERARNHPLYSLLHDQPNSRQTSFEWRRDVLGHVVLRGNHYSRIVPGPRGFADQLVPLDPSRMQVDQLANGALRYTYRRTDGTPEVIGQDEIFHVRGLGSDGITGIGVVTLAREGLGLATATEQYGARFFSQKAQPGGVLEHPGKLTPEASTRLARSWQEAHAGLDKAHKVAVLEDGVKWHQVGLSNEDAQWLATREFGVREVARWLNLPLHMLRADGPTASYASIEMFGQEFVTYTMMPWLVNFEQRANSDLVLAPETYFIEFLVDSLLRGDSAARANFYRTMVTMGAFTRNEVREKENMNPLEGLDEPLVPQNMATLDDDGNVKPVNQGQPSAPARQPKQGARADRAREFAGDIAGRLVRKEIAALSKQARRAAADSADWQRFVESFYDEHAADVALALHLTDEAARAYCGEQREAVLRDGVGVMGTWEGARVEYLVTLALEG